MPARAPLFCLCFLAARPYDLFLLGKNGTLRTSAQGLVQAFTITAHPHTELATRAERVVGLERASWLELAVLRVLHTAIFAQSLLFVSAYDWVSTASGFLQGCFVSAGSSLWPEVTIGVQAMEQPSMPWRATQSARTQRFKRVPRRRSSRSGVLGSFSFHVDACLCSFT